MLQEIKTEAKNTTTIKINTSLFIITSFCLMNVLLLFSADINRKRFISVQSMKTYIQYLLKLLPFGYY